MKIKIYAIGKIKEPFLKEGVNEYCKRIKLYSNLEIIEINDEAMPLVPSNKDILNAKEKEGNRVIKLLKNDEYLIGLDLNKKQLKSEEFADFLQKNIENHGASISFVIGGSYGLSDTLKKRCNDFLTLSQMTFLHTMTRLILLEQIYRAIKINRNETYHK